MFKLFNFIFYKSVKSYIHDWKFWILLLSINMSGNLAFITLFPARFLLVLLFLVLFLYCFNKKLFTSKVLLFLGSFILLFSIQSVFAPYYGIVPTLHQFLKISSGVFLILALGNKFYPYYNTLIIVYSLISLVCFALNNLGIILPYIPITESNIDGGYIFRVYSLYYTQLYNPLSETIALRNCGPFWEPGAFQGFLNLALFFEINFFNKCKFSNTRIFILVITILTTISTGGYILLFLNLLILIKNTRKISNASKVFFTIIFLCICLYLFFSLDFLSSKISSDMNEGEGGRLSFSLESVKNNPSLLFWGYGYDERSFVLSSVDSVSSLVNLIKFIGVMGLLLFLSTIFFHRMPHYLFYVIFLLLCLTNEPFLSNSFLWWGTPFLCYKYGTSKLIK